MHLCGQWNDQWNDKAEQLNYGLAVIFAKCDQAISVISNQHGMGEYLDPDCVLANF